MKRQRKPVGRMAKASYKILFDKKCIKELEKIPEHFRESIDEKVRDLAYNPRPIGHIKLKGSKKIHFFAFAAEIIGLYMQSRMIS